MFQLCHHQETACHSQPSVMTTWQTGVGGGPYLTAAHSVRRDMCQITLYSKTYRTNSCQTSRVDLCVLFFCTVPPTVVGNHLRGCLLKQDMSAGDNANCYSGRLSIGDLQGHTPWVFFAFLVETDYSIQEKHISDSSQIFASCSCWHTRYFRRHTCFDPSSR